jgi:hypothetical protein
MAASAYAAVPAMILPGARAILELARLLGRAAARDGWAES